MEKISAVLITRNEAKRVRPALMSLSWVDEIVVLDFMSADGTAEICREYTDRVHRESWVGFVHGRNRATALASHPWVISVDADERVESGLRDEIRTVLDSGADCAGYYIPRRMIYMGREIRHCGWYPDAKLRFFRRDAARWVGGAVHERCEVDGPVGRLAGHLTHCSYESLAHHVEKVNFYTDLYARNRYDQGRNVSLAAVILTPPWTFLKKYLLQRGFLDGLPGITICLLSAFTVYLKKGKLRELHRQAEQRQSLNAPPGPEAERGE